MPLLRHTPLALILLAACGPDMPAADMDTVPEYSASALEFGMVSVSGERILSLEITAGTAELRTLSVRSTSAAFRFRSDPRLRTGLSPNETAAIEVRFRPCPEAWDDDELIEGFDFDACSIATASARLEILDSRSGWVREVGLFGAAGAPATLELTCSVAPGCTEPDVTTRGACTGLDLGTVSAGTSCQRTLVLRNTATDGAPLTIRALDLHDPDDKTSMVEVHAEFPIEITAGESVDVDVTIGVRGAGAYAPTILVRSDDPKQQPHAPVPVTGRASAPQLEATPAAVSLLRQAPGKTDSVVITLRNRGDEPLSIYGVELASGAAITHDVRGAFTIAAGEMATVALTYHGSETALDDALIIRTDAADGTLEIPVSVTPVPRLCLEPEGELKLGPNGLGDIVFMNCGDGELTIDAIAMTAVEGSANSLSELTIEGCGDRCEPGLRLCSAGDPSCRISRVALHVVHDNLDLSATDEALVTIRTNDPLQPTRFLRLTAGN